MKKTCIALFLFLSFHNLGIAQNIIGSFQHIKSRVMGGYRISSTSNLEISRNEKKEIRYFVITTVVDEYNGSVPRIEETSGVIKLINNKYKFIGGSYAERGAYIILNNKMNSKVLISFAPGRGDAMLFDKKVIIDDKINSNSLNGTLDVQNDFITELKKNKNIFKLEKISEAQIQKLLQLDLEIPKEKLVINEYKLIADSLRLYRTKIGYNDKDKEDGYLFFGGYPSYDVIIFNIDNYVLSCLSIGSALTTNCLYDLTSKVKLSFNYNAFPGGTPSYEYKYLNEKLIVDIKLKKNLEKKFAIYLDPYNFDLLVSNFKVN
jgi:hypothetical protein